MNQWITIKTESIVDWDMYYEFNKIPVSTLDKEDKYKIKYNLN